MFTDPARAVSGRGASEGTRRISRNRRRPPIPHATYATKSGTPARLGYYDNYLVDNRSCVFVGVQATAARMSQKTVAAQDMNRSLRPMARTRARISSGRCHAWQRRVPAVVNAARITPYMRTRDNALRKNNPLHGLDRFTYLPESNSYRCPAGQQLNFVGLNVRNRAYAYIGSRKRCGRYLRKAQCTIGQYKYLAIHIHEPPRQRLRLRRL